MIFKRKKPKRLYIPSKKRWYTRPRRKPRAGRKAKILKKGIFGTLKDIAKKSFLTLLTIALIAVIIVILGFSSYFTVRDIEVAREDFNIDSSAIENELNMFIGKNIFSVSKDDIRNEILQKFPEFRKVDISKKFPAHISIRLISYPVVANLKAYYSLPEPEEKIEEKDFTELSKAIEELSGSDPDIALLAENPMNDKKVTDDIFDLAEEDKNKDYTEQKGLLNQIGQVIFDREENLELPMVIINSLTQPFENRQQVIPREHMEYILESIKYINNLQLIEAEKIEYLPIAREIRLIAKNRLSIWLSANKDYREQIDKFHTIYEPAGLDKENLSYIDLRVSEKVIYCPRNARCDK